MSDEKQLTVGALIELLRQIDPALPVDSEGCDCEGAAIGVVVYGDDRVLVSRNYEGLARATWLKLAGRWDIKEGQ